MANIPFKSITFPGLANKYQVPEISNDLMTQGKAADSKKVGDELSEIKADLERVANCTAIPDNSDLDDFVETGLYSVENTNYNILHYPVPENKIAGTLEVFALSSGYIQQTFFKGSGRLFTRVRFGNGTWNDWIQITRNAEIEFPFNAKEELIACLKHVAWKDSDGESHFDNLASLLNVLNIETLLATGKRVNIVSLPDSQYDVKYNIYSGQDNTRAMMYAPNGTRSIVSDNGTATEYYPIKIPADIRKIWFDGAKENEYAVNVHVMYYDSNISAFRRVVKDESFDKENAQWKYDDLDGDIWKLDISDVNDGNLYMIGMFAKSHSSRTVTDSNGNQHAMANLDGTAIDSNVNKIVLRMV